MSYRYGGKGTGPDYRAVDYRDGIMREFLYKVEDPLGLHARPASRLFMEAMKFKCRIDAVGADGETADCKNLLAVMGLGAVHGSELLFRFDGADEAQAEAALKCTLSES